MRGAAYSVRERELLMRMHEGGKSLSVLSRETGIARSLLSRWWQRYREQGRAGLQPRSRRPERSPNRLAASIEHQILQLRDRGWGPARIAPTLHIGHTSVHRVLSSHGRNRLRLPQPRVVHRYEKSRPGELLHLDLKYLYRWRNCSREYAYAAVDDFSREAVASIRPKRSSPDAASFMD
jgi:transposase